MYFKNICLINVGPIEELHYDFQFNDSGNPKPLILVGTNGSGKSILLSYLLNALLSAQQVAFDDTEVESGKVYKIRSPHYIKTGATFSYGKVNFASDFNCSEWQLILPRDQYIEKYGDPDIDNSFHQIPSHKTSTIHNSFVHKPIEVSKEFQSNCVLYFPANRFEQPAWLNINNLKAEAEFIDQPRIHRISNRQIIQKSPLIISKNWLLDVFLDRSIYELKIRPIDYPFQDPVRQENFKLTLQLFDGYQGNSHKILAAITQIIKLIFKTDEDENVRVGIGSRKNRTISITKNNKQLIPNIFQLSTGQTSILNIALSILRDFDMSGATFETLEDIRGVVLIDEVDAHLHADLQCNLLPVVISMFPKVQFILTTHSPLFLLGMKSRFGENGFDVLSMPTGETIDLEDFEEFKSAFEFYQESNTFREKIKAEIEKSQKPAIFVEGDYDIKYLNKAASLLGKEKLLDRIILYDGKGFGNLDKIWKTCKDSNLTIAFPKIVGLIYDCDTNKKDQDRDIAKKRIIPSSENHPISKGIENLFPASTINKLRQSHPKFFDITPEFCKIVRGEEKRDPEICETNKQEKKNLCDWLCKNGTEEDFAEFESVFNLIEDIIGDVTSQNIQ